MRWESVVPVLIAFLGLASALVTGYVAGRRQAQLERQREVRLAVAEVARNLGAAIHAISWFTWKAENRPTQLGTLDAQEYDADMKAVFPALTGSLAVLAALSHDAFSRAELLVKEIYSLDERTAIAATGLIMGSKDAPASVAALREESRALEASVNTRASQIMEGI